MKKGVTLMELIVCIAIVGFVASIILSALKQEREKVEWQEEVVIQKDFKFSDRVRIKDDFYGNPIGIIKSKSAGSLYTVWIGDDIKTHETYHVDELKLIK